MHLLDLLMYFVCLGVIYCILYLISGGDYTEEMGGALVWAPIAAIFTIIYIILFAFAPDWNWCDFDYTFFKNFKIKL